MTLQRVQGFLDSPVFPVQAMSVARPDGWFWGERLKWTPSAMRVFSQVSENHRMRPPRFRPSLPRTPSGLHLMSSVSGGRCSPPLHCKHQVKPR